MFRFGSKVAIAGSAVYYLNKEGVWKTSDESLQVYDKIKTVSQPHIEQLQQQFQLELPRLPTFERPSSEAVKSAWNAGVLYACEALGQLPDNSKKWACQGYRTVVNHPEVKKLFQTLPATTPQPDPNKITTA